MIEFLKNLLGPNLGYAVWYLIKAVIVIVPLTLLVAYVTLAERRILGFMHARIGANRVGPKGLFQPFADLLKFVFKEIIIPAKASKAVFFLAPAVILICALTLHLGF